MVWLNGLLHLVCGPLIETPERSLLNCLMTVATNQLASCLRSLDKESWLGGNLGAIQLAFHLRIP